MDTEENRSKEDHDGQGKEDSGLLEPSVIQLKNERAMIVTGYRMDNFELPNINPKVDKIRSEDQEMLSTLQRCSNGHDKEVEKLTKELRDANNILANLEQSIELLKAKKELNQHELMLIKGEYKTLLQEKYNCEKQIALIRRDSDKIKDKRVLRDFDQLGICYEKLCQKERATRKQIALLEAELSMIVSKIDIPKSRSAAKTGNVVPKLELDRLKKEEKRGLPPVKNPPKAPRRGNTIYPKDQHVVEFSTAKVKGGKNKLLKRITAPQHAHAQTSSSTPFLKDMVPRFTGEIETHHYLPLLGNQKQLASRPAKHARGDNIEPRHTMEVKLPKITEVKEKKQVELISDKLPVQQRREPKKKNFLSRKSCF